MGSGLMLVVIRFQICIFDILNTAELWFYPSRYQL